MAPTASGSPTEFHVEVVRIGAVEKHPNADSLSLTNVLGYPVVFRTGDFRPDDFAVYVPVDALVPTSRPEFAFLAKPGHERHRVRAARLRGIFSMGLLVPMSNLGPAYAFAGADAARAFDITKWEPPAPKEQLARGAQRARQAPGWMPVYGVEGYRRHTGVLKDGEEVVITEKIHGTNARYCYRGSSLYVGSHRTLRGTSRGVVAEWFNRLWLKLRTAFGDRHRASLFAESGDVWWDAAQKFDLKAKLATKPDCVVYGEIYGVGVQDLTYGCATRRFRVFDVLDIKAGRYLDYDELLDFCAGLDLEMPPCLYRGPWSTDLLALAEGKSTLEGADNIREGFVVRPVKERVEHMGRVILKVVGVGYLLRKEAE